VSATEAIARARSLLFAPGDDERKLDKAAAAGAHGVIADLEDGVAPSAREAARASIEAAFAGDPRGLLRCVRINPPDSPDHERDLELVRGLPEIAIVLPKASPAGLADLPATAPVIAIVESAAGLDGARELAAHEAVEALALGNLDLSADLGLRPRRDGMELLAPRAMLVLVSAVAGIRAPFDGVHADFRDEAGLREEVELGASLGMRGKLCIHPAQVAAVNEGFAPSQPELAWARAVLEEAEAAGREGRGVAVLDGAMIDAPVIRRARALLEGESTEVDNR
jgi:citrate lyase subunit beta / citryl-CoA lyase